MCSCETCETWCNLSAKYEGSHLADLCVRRYTKLFVLLSSVFIWSISWVSNNIIPEFLSYCQDMSDLSGAHFHMEIYAWHMEKTNSINCCCVCFSKDRLKTTLCNLGKVSKFKAAVHFLNLGVHRYWPHKVKKENNSTSPWLSSEEYSMHHWHSHPWRYFDSLCREHIESKHLQSGLFSWAAWAAKTSKYEGHGKRKKKTKQKRKGMKKKCQ